MFCIVNAHAQTRAETLRNRYRRPEDDSNRIWIMAHRGAWDEVSPESSNTAFSNAVAYGFEILELDVRFSARYRLENNVQVADTNGEYREIILQHDKSNMRSDIVNGASVLTYGLYKFHPSQEFTPDVKKKNKFVMLDKLVPYRNDGKNCIDGPGQVHPVLLKLDSTASTSRMVHFPHTAIITTNTDLANFATAVKGKILLNFDKLVAAKDFQETYDIMDNNGLLNQSIFKAKGVVDYASVQALFGAARSLKRVMFTPIFTKYDFTTENQETGTTTQLFSKAVKLEKAKNTVNSLFAAEQDSLIVFPGCEIVYETYDTTDENYGWLPLLADYVKNVKNKRIVQFSTNLESKLGAWSGNGNFWSDLVGLQVNYWSWLFANPAPYMTRIKASVFVGDKPLEFRSYLNSLGYNQRPIQ